MLTIHSWFIVFPALVPPLAMLAWRRRRDPDTVFLMLLDRHLLRRRTAIFFAGSARYLLPIAAPVAILASRLPYEWLRARVRCQLDCEAWARRRQLPALGRLSPVRRVVASATAGQRVWVDDDWGLRYYIEADQAPCPRARSTRHARRRRRLERTRPQRGIHAPHVQVARRHRVRRGPAPPDRTRIALRLFHRGRGLLAVRDLDRRRRPRGSAAS